MIDKNKNYTMILPMIVYTSGKIHVGHLLSYTITDVYYRHMDRKGRKVIQPFGFDSFGLPADVKAREEGMHPYEWNKICIREMKRDLSLMSIKIDGRMINTCDPAYYNYGQKIFVEMYKSGLIYRDISKVIYAPVTGTVLAKEQVSDGRFERTGEKVIYVDKEQWFFKLKSFSDRLYDTDNIKDWGDNVKRMQKKYIMYEGIYSLGEIDGVEVLSETNTLLFNKMSSSSMDRIDIENSIFIPEGKIICSKGDRNSLLEVEGFVKYEEPIKKNLYRLHDWCLSRQRTFGCPIPACICSECGIVVSEDLISVNPLYYNKYVENMGYENWLKVQCPGCGGEASRERDTLDTLWDSSFYYIYYSKVLRKESITVDTYVGGVEHACGHLLYTRAINMAMYDIGMVEDPFIIKRMLTNGMIYSDSFLDEERMNYISPKEVWKDGKGSYFYGSDTPVKKMSKSKMSKSKNNAIEVSEVLRKYESDSIRFFVLSDKSIDKDREWSFGHLDKVEQFIKNVRNRISVNWNFDKTYSSFSPSLPYEKEIFEKSMLLMDKLKYNVYISLIYKVWNDWSKYGLSDKKARYDLLILELLRPVCPDTYCVFYPCL